MSYRLIKLNSGHTIPSIGLGCYDIPRNKTVSVVYEACKVGYRHFDTAVLYGNEEEVIEGISKPYERTPIYHDLSFTPQSFGIINWVLQALNKPFQQ